MKNKKLIWMIALIFGFTAVVCAINLYLVKQDQVPVNRIRLVTDQSTLIPTEELSQIEFDAELHDALGRVFNNHCRGVEMSVFLTQQGIMLDQVGSVTLTAQDQYQVTIPADLIASGRVYLVTHENGKALTGLNGEGFAPRLVVLEDENSQRAIRCIMEIKVEEK